jgi:xanthine dehydrogenase accessory factor
VSSLLPLVKGAGGIFRILRNIYIQFLDELKRNDLLALATIIETKGSTPQIPGASALFSKGGLCAGTVGGGLLEADAQKKALQSLQQKVSLLYEFSLTSDISSAEGAICGGEATILIDARPEDHIEIFQSISKSLSQRQPGVLATFILRYSEGNISLARCWIEMGDSFTADSDMPYARFPESLKSLNVERFQRFQRETILTIRKKTEKCLIENRPNLLKMKETIFSEEVMGRIPHTPGREEETSLFLEPIYPLPHLIIAGAGHVGQAVSHLGSLLDFEVTVIDDRPEFANKEKLPEADSIIVDDIGKAMQAISISPDTYIVIVTRGHKNDADALRQCIDSRAAYVGMIGSARKIELMREKFLQEGWATSTQWDRVHAPIGVEIQSKTVQEIAVSIAAQLVLVRRQNQAFGKSFSRKDQEAK